MLPYLARWADEECDRVSELYLAAMAAGKEIRVAGVVDSEIRRGLTWGKAKLWGGAESACGA